jgi:hypothetical protein
MYKIMYNNSKAECVVGLLTFAVSSSIHVGLRKSGQYQERRKEAPANPTNEHDVGAPAVGTVQKHTEQSPNAPGKSTDDD